VFADNVHLGLGADGVRLPTGELLTVGDDCRGEPMQLHITRWLVDEPGRAPQTFDHDLRSIHFDGDREAYTISFAPAGAAIPKPPSIPELDRLTDVPTEDAPSMVPG
jgi:hypothetical protein